MPTRRYTPPEMAARIKFGPAVRQSMNVWWGWLFRAPPPDRGSIVLPGDDRVEYRERRFRGGRSPRRYRITHPYHLSWPELRALVHLCERYSLEMTLHGGSWRSPRAFTVVMTAIPEEE